MPNKVTNFLDNRKNKTMITIVGYANQLVIQKINTKAYAAIGLTTTLVTLYDYSKLLKKKPENN
jgi:hypothetical protein